MPDPTELDDASLTAPWTADATRRETLANPTEATPSRAQKDRATVAETRPDTASPATQPETGAPPSARPARGETDEAGDLLANRYELRHLLGHGQFGEVWQAHDRDLDRDVALKVLKARMCRPHLLQAFELERQVIGRMEHPHIAKVFDGGTLADGRPFLAMELVRGQTLTAFCRQRELAVRQRVELFLPICRAVHHAHERFVLHRDLKPSNILVSESDVTPAPKVIDFGIAKVLEEGAFSADLTSSLDGSIQGTPIYMSPEQTRSNTELTVRSDVYTLGVILYELLTGATPLAGALKKGAAYVDVIVAIRESEPVLPSLSRTRREAGEANPAPEGVAQARIARQLRGDLDVILLRAMEKDPARRYASAADFAADLERHLRDEPILARPPTLGYRLRKYVRRHRAMAAAAGVIGLGLAASAAVAVHSDLAVRRSLVRETEQRLEAEVQRGFARQRRAEAEAAQMLAEKNEIEAATARDVALRARGEAEELIGYMLFELREQLEPLGRSRLLAGVAERAEQYFAAQPAATDDARLERNRAVMFYNRGRILLAQGDTTAAVEKFTRSREIFLRPPAASDSQRSLDLATANYGLGLALRAAGEADKAREIFTAQLEPLRTSHRDGLPGADRLLAATLEQLGELELQSDRGDAALRLFVEQEAIARNAHGDASDKRRAMLLATACEKVGTALLHLSRLPEAQAKFEEEIALIDSARSDTLDIQWLHSRSVAGGKLGSVLHTLRRSDDARQRFEERLGDAELLAQLDPRRVAFQRELSSAHHHLSAALVPLGRGREAVNHAREHLRLTTEGATQPGTAPAETDTQPDLAGAHLQLALALLVEKPRKPATLIEAKEHLSRAADLSESLRAAGKLDARGESRLELLRNELQNLERARSAAPAGAARQ